MAVTVAVGSPSLPFPSFPLSSPISAKPLLFPLSLPTSSRPGTRAKTPFFFGQAEEREDKTRVGEKLQYRKAPLSEIVLPAQGPISVERVRNNGKKNLLFLVFFWCQHTFDFEPNAPLQLAAETVTSGVRMLRNSLKFSPLWLFL